MKQNQTKRNETDRNEMKCNKTKRNQTKRNEMQKKWKIQYGMKTKRVYNIFFDYPNLEDF